MIRILFAFYTEELPLCTCELTGPKVQNAATATNHILVFIPMLN